MASQNNASTTEAKAVSFGGWLRQLRDEQGLPQRAVAAAAAMDSSHYGKVETGKRLLTEDQAVAIAHLLKVPEADMRARMMAAQFLVRCGGDHALAAQAAGIVQEHAAPYIVSKSVSNRTKKR